MNTQDETLCCTRYKTAGGALNHLRRCSIVQLEIAKCQSFDRGVPFHFKYDYSAYAIRQSVDGYYAYMGKDDDDVRGDDGFFDCDALFYLEDLITKEGKILKKPKPSWQRKGVKLKIGKPYFRK